MNPDEILSRNHDVHLHSSNFSDGWHTVDEVARYAARFQNPPRWVGISDHSPDIISKQGKTSPAWESSTHAYRRISAYARRINSYGEILEKEGIRLLAGIELEWQEAAPLANLEEISELDYVISAYHGRRLSSSREIETFFQQVGSHPITDILAHPNHFLGSPDVNRANWKSIFSHLADHGVCCEYNLTTPLSEEIFEIAASQTKVQFVISSDTHDFRQLSTTRVSEAWSESLSGGFNLAYRYLKGLVSTKLKKQQSDDLTALFNTPEKLIDLEGELYQRSIHDRSVSRPLSRSEQDLIVLLESLPPNQLDEEFQQHRLARFSTLPPERIASLLPAEQFLEVVRAGRAHRLAVKR